MACPGHDSQGALGSCLTAMRDRQMSKERLVATHDEEFDRLILADVWLFEDVGQICSGGGFPLVQTN